MQRLWHVLYGPFVGGRGAAGLLGLRLVAGAALMLHGWNKIQMPFSWMGPDATVPGVFQLLAAVSEFGGGLALMVGLLTPIAAFGVACTMAYATVFVHWKSGDEFVSPLAHSYESSLGYFAIAVLLILIGPGRFSLDALLQKKFGAKKFLIVGELPPSGQRSSGMSA